MLRQKAVLLRNINIILDILVTVFSFFLAYYLKGHVLPSDYTNLYPLNVYVWMLPVIIPLWYILLYIEGIYASVRIKSPLQLAWMISKAVFYGLLVIFGIFFIFKIQNISRLFIVIFASIDALLLFLTKLAVIKVLQIFRSRGYNFRTMLIVGSRERAEFILRRVHEHSEWGFRVIGALLSECTETKVGSVPVLGDPFDLQKTIHENPVDDVIFAMPFKRLDEMVPLISICEEEGVQTHIMADFYKPTIAQTHFEDFSGIPMLTFSSTPHQEGALLAKRVFDIAGSLFLITLLSPVFPLVALGIKLSSRGPVFFIQERTGLNGRRFKLYKFRSMVHDAEKKLEELEHLNEMNGPVFKIRKDPRITGFGALLRKYSLDEFPQLFNVLKGDMSFVGPRPALLKEVEEYDRWQRRRLSMKPGITCIWQSNGRTEIDFEDWMKLDLQYIDNWSLALDFKILLKTIPMVLMGKGAY